MFKQKVRVGRERISTNLRKGVILKRDKYANEELKGRNHVSFFTGTGDKVTTCEGYLKLHFIVQYNVNAWYIYSLGVSYLIKTKK